MDSLPKACCSPTADRALAPVAAPARAGSVTSAVRDGMIALPGGTFLMGTDSPEAFVHDGEGPVREVTLAPFAIDRFPVTNAQFASFVSATQYATEAERFGWSFVFWRHVDAALVEDTVAAAPWWCKVAGAHWARPEGPGSSVATRAQHPVVHVSWNDAAAYAAWTGQRLPTEAEWEYAARGGLVQQMYPWGNKLRPNGEHRCNIWQGDFPHLDTSDDGFAGTCPVDAFPPNSFGLYSMTGNAWEWCADWFSADHHLNAATLNPTGPVAGEARSMRGGSFLCHKSYCNRYRVAARTRNTPDSSASNVGFRCAF